jgi:hypothetical protein
MSGPVRVLRGCPGAKHPLSHAAVAAPAFDGRERSPEAFAKGGQLVADRPPLDHPKEKAVALVA